MSTDLIIADEIRSKIFSIRGMQVMLDRDLAELYGVETRTLNQAVILSCFQTFKRKHLIPKLRFGNPIAKSEFRNENIFCCTEVCYMNESELVLITSSQDTAKK